MLFGAIAEASAERQRDGGAPIETLVKWNPRSGGTEAVIEWALGDATLVWHHPREGKRTAVFEDTLERRGGDGAVHTLRRVLTLTERTIDRHGQRLLVARYDVAGFLTTLDAERVDAETVIAFYRDHTTHEQFHSELKTDLDLARLPSGKFATNDLVFSLAGLAYNVLRLVGAECAHRQGRSAAPFDQAPAAAYGHPRADDACRRSGQARRDPTLVTLTKGLAGAGCCRPRLARADAASREESRSCRPRQTGDRRLKLRQTADFSLRWGVAFIIDCLVALPHVRSPRILNNYIRGSEIEVVRVNGSF